MDRNPIRKENWVINTSLPLTLRRAVNENNNAKQASALACTSLDTRLLVRAELGELAELNCLRLQVYRAKQGLVKVRHQNGNTHLFLLPVNDLSKTL